MSQESCDVPVRLTRNDVVFEVGDKDMTDAVKLACVKYCTFGSFSVKGSIVSKKSFKDPFRLTRDDIVNDIVLEVGDINVAGYVAQLMDTWCGISTKRCKEYKAKPVADLWHLDYIKKSFLFKWMLGCNPEDIRFTHCTSLFSFCLCAVPQADLEKALSSSLEATNADNLLKTIIQTTLDVRKKLGVAIEGVPLMLSPQFSDEPAYEPAYEPVQRQLYIDENDICALGLEPIMDDLKDMAWDDRIYLSSFLFHPLNPLTSLFCDMYYEALFSEQSGVRYNLVIDLFFAYLRMCDREFILDFVKEAKKHGVYSIRVVKISPCEPGESNYEQYKCYVAQMIYLAMRVLSEEIKYTCQILRYEIKFISKCVRINIETIRDITTERNQILLYFLQLIRQQADYFNVLQHLETFMEMREENYLLRYYVAVKSVEYRVGNLSLGVSSQIMPKKDHIINLFDLLLRLFNERIITERLLATKRRLIGDSPTPVYETFRTQRLTNDLVPDFITYFALKKTLRFNRISAKDIKILDVQGKQIEHDAPQALERLQTEIKIQRTELDLHEPIDFDCSELVIERQRTEFDLHEPIVLDYSELLQE